MDPTSGFWIADFGFRVLTSVLRPSSFVLSLSAPTAQPTQGWLLVAAVVFVCAGLAAAGIGVAMAARPRLRTRSRIERFALNVGGVEVGPLRRGKVPKLTGRKSHKRALAPTLRKEQPIPALFQWAGREVRRMESGTKKVVRRLRGTGPHFTGLRTLIAAADVNMSVEKLLLMQAGAGLLLAALLWPISAVLALGGLLAVSTAPGLYLKRRARRRLARFEEQLPDTLQLLSMSLRGGFSLFQALQMLASEADEPSKSEFGRLVHDVTLGSSLENAVRGLYRRIPTQDVDILVTAILLQVQSGGNLSHLLDVVAKTLRDRKQVEREIHALTAQQRFSGILLGLLPPVLVMVLFVLAPGYIGPLFAPGWVLLIPVGAGLWALIGFYVMMRMSKIDV